MATNLAAATIIRDSAAVRFAAEFGGDVQTFEGSSDRFIEVSARDLHDAIRGNEIIGASFGLTYDWMRQRWTEAR